MYRLIANYLCCCKSSQSLTKLYLNVSGVVLCHPREPACRQAGTGIQTINTFKIG